MPTRKEWPQFDFNLEEKCHAERPHARKLRELHFAEDTSRE